MKKFIIICSLLFIYLNVNAQYTLNGFVKDIQNNLPIPGAMISVNNSQESTTTNDNGSFTLTTKNETNVLNIKAIGYEKKEVTLKSSDVNIVIGLQATNLSTGEIYVEGFSNNRKNIETPGSIGLLTKSDLDRDIGINIQNTVNLVPGVNMEFRNLGSGVLLAIRGYGVQTNFNGNGYKAYYNDISLTDADGTTALDEVDYTNLSTVEVFKGPSSSIYGANIAGVLNLKTARAPWGTNLIIGGQGGSFGLFRTNTGFSVGNEKLNLFVNYGHQKYTGFRDHNQSKEDFAVVNGNVYFDKKNTLSFFGNYSNVFNALAGEQDSTTFHNNPTAADTQYVHNDAHIKSESSRIGITLDHTFSNIFSNKTTLYGGFFYLDQPYAVGLSRGNNSKLGARTTFSVTPVFGKIKTNIIFGGEFLENINFSQSYGLTDGILGSLRGNQQIKPMMYSVFGQADVNVTKSTLLTAGSSVNFMEYTVIDMIAKSQSHVNASGYNRFSPIVTPRIAINQVFKDMVSVYASVSTGFTPPSTSQILITQLGQVNNNIKPESALSFEIGSKGDLLKKTLNYEITAYQMDVKDKLVTQNFGPSGGNLPYSITTNAGKVRYRGIEAKVSYAYLPAKSNIITLVRPFLTYTYTNDKNIDFKSNNNNDSTTVNYSGLKVPGVAPNVLNAGLDVESKQGVYLNLTYSWTDKIFLSFDNAHFAPSHGLLNSRIGIRRSVGNNFKLEVYGGADNMTGQLYASELFLNPFDKHFYIAGPNKITFYGGATVSYNFKK